MLIIIIFRFRFSRLFFKKEIESKLQKQVLLLVRSFYISPYQEKRNENNEYQRSKP